MKKEANYTIDKFKNATMKLKEAVLQSKSELEKDGAIQRFEFTFELLWKTIKIFLREKGIECLTPRDCLKEAFRVGLIEEEKIYLDMLEDRNITSHIYDKETADKIFNRIKNRYTQAIENLLNKLKI